MVQDPEEKDKEYRASLAVNQEKLDKEYSFSCNNIPSKLSGGYFRNRNGRSLTERGRRNGHSRRTNSFASC